VNYNASNVDELTKDAFIHLNKCKLEFLLEYSERMDEPPEDYFDFAGALGHRM
jgi:hypothetical protein